MFRVESNFIKLNVRLKMLIACQHWVQNPIKFLPAPTFPSTKLSKYGPKVNPSALTRRKIKTQIWIL